jgi:2-polyprenyl-3-methyl-5-hydroxy-6-metoxy-1,4-benzoquinol methylase
MNKHPFDWLNDNKSHFSPNLNGHYGVPLGPYISTLPLISTDGKILDLGCGNGMLLKFLMEFSERDLIPYGIDYKKECIEYLQKKILPEYKDNFKITEIKEFDFIDAPYDIIITNPFYCYPEVNEFKEKLLSVLNKDGIIIYRIHNDVLENFNIKEIDDLIAILGKDLTISVGSGLWLATLNK